jgi:hypothetical protein
MFPGCGWSDEPMEVFGEDQNSPNTSCGGYSERDGIDAAGVSRHGVASATLFAAFSMIDATAWGCDT